jgi:hypothetical protein
MTEHERLMYEVLGRISATEAPIIFKGALITKLVLAEHGYTALDRLTRDVDANWIGEPPTMHDLVGTVQKSLGDLQEQFYAVAIREYEEKRSAGISIRSISSDKEIMSMDISIKPYIGGKMYYYGEIGIKGVLPTEVLADKITVLSKHLVFRRAKDLIDVYALAHCVEIKTQEIYNVMTRKSAMVGRFAEINNRRDDIEHAYGKLRGIEGKPLFSDVYPYLIKFLHPFALNDITPRVWNNEKQSWDDCRDKKPSLLAQMRKIEEEIERKKSNPVNEPTKRKKRDYEL